MENSIGFRKAFSKILKYLIGGLVVAFAAFILPNNKLQWSEIWLLGLITACTFSILDLLYPHVSNGAHHGVGLGSGFQLARL
jgi:predicted outer membrane lipoprotein